MTQDFSNDLLLGDEGDDAEGASTLTFQRVGLIDPLDELRPGFSEGGAFFWRQLSVVLDVGIFRAAQRLKREVCLFPAVLGHNDVRVNRLSLSLLRLWKRPLPDVLGEYIMEPIDASDTWQWHGYRNSEVDVEGETILSVSGGGHWGGGVWMSTRGLARFGYLHLRRGKWKDQQLLSEQ